MSRKAAQQPVATVVQGHTFTVDPRYEPSKVLGRGSFGVVCTAFDKERGENIAIKRIRPFANDEWDARHTLREIRLMKLLGKHPNIISLFDLSIYEEKAELYMMMELMDCDLHRIIQSKQGLTEMHFKCFARQLLEAVKAMHQMGVFHRDLKPGNILVSKDCQLRITDFGLARFMDESTLSGRNRQNPMTEYVVTRWYRCPELLLSPNIPYSAAIDMWSVGCIIGELIKRKPLFPGKSHANQVQLILEIKGYSSPSDLGFELSGEATTFLDRRCRYQPKPLETFIPNASKPAMTLLEGLLQLNPRARPTASEALMYDFVRDAQVLCDYTSVQMVQRVDERLFDFEHKEYTLEELQAMVREEVSRPCDDSIFELRTSPMGGLTRDLSQNRLSNKSQHSTHHRNSSEQSTTEADEDFRGYEGSYGTSNRFSVPEKKTLTRSGSAVSTSTNKSNQPPTPSPKKIEAIAKQEKKQKRRFFLQGLQGIRQNGESDRPPVDESEELTYRRSNSATAKTISENIIRPTSHRSKYLAAGNAEEKEQEVSNVLNNFQSVSLSARDTTNNRNNEYGGNDNSNFGIRKLTSQPAPQEHQSFTKFPILMQSKTAKYK